LAKLIVQVEWTKILLTSFVEKINADIFLSETMVQGDKVSALSQTISVTFAVTFHKVFDYKH